MGAYGQIPGLATAVSVALFATLLSSIHASFDALVISILAGMVIGNAVSKAERYRPGIESAVRFLLPVGIALYGTQLKTGQLGLGEVVRIFLVFAALFCLTFFLSRVFGLNRKITILLSSGLAICGASAIAVVSPLIRARREDTSISIISVMMLGLIGMILYPILGDMLMLRETEFAFYAGSTLPMLGQVKITAGGVGRECLELAMNTKLIRISFLLFIIIFATTFSIEGERKFRVPWFVVVFFACAALVNFTGLLLPYLASLKTLSAFFLSAGLAAVGFSVSFEAIIDEGVRPLGVVLLAWSVVLVVLYLSRNII